MASFYEQTSFLPFVSSLTFEKGKEGILIGSGLFTEFPVAVTKLLGMTNIEPITLQYNDGIRDIVDLYTPGHLLFLGAVIDRKKEGEDIVYAVKASFTKTPQFKGLGRTARKPINCIQSYPEAKEKFIQMHDVHGEWVLTTIYYCLLDEKPCKLLRNTDCPDYNEKTRE